MSPDPIDTGGETTAVNPHLKQILGYPAETPEAEIVPFAPDRFFDPASRATFLRRLSQHGMVTDFPLRLRRADGAAVRVEVTAHAEVIPADGSGPLVHVEALVRDVSERKK